ncbi:foldase protein PrsA [Cerasibacillus sp. JNUCC 74]
MSKKLLLGIIIILLITNIGMILVWSSNGQVDVKNDGVKRKFSNKEVVATVNGEDIIFQKWHEALKNTYGEEKLKAMIDRILVQQLAEKKRIKISDKVIEREISLLLAMQGVLSRSEYKELEADWENDIRYRYQLQMLLTEDIPVSEAKIKEYYARYGKHYNFTSSMQLSHIVVKDKKTAEKIYEELESGASYSLLAQEYSLDEETKSEGGYLGFISTESQFFPKGYEEIAAEMNEHSYSKPFEADNGIAILYLHRKLPSITFTYEEIKPYIKSELALNEKNQSLDADSLWEKQDIEWIYEKSE